MHNRESAEPRMKPWGNPYLLGALAKASYQEAPEAVTLRNNKVRLISNLKFHATWFCEKDQ